ncbi:putative reverse transcriptase domain-containing protein [Tanacetum coccineum]
MRDGIEAAIRAERERVREEATRAGGLAGGPTAAPVAQECTFTGFMKCGPTQFHGTEGTVGLCRWFEKMESTFEISEYAKGRKVATFGREVANGRPWTEVKQMLIDKFCPIEEVQRFNELALLCPDDVPTEKKKVELYIKGFPKIIKCETTSSRPATLNEVVRMAHALMEQKIQAKDERIAEGLKRKWESNNQGGSNYRNNNRGNYRDNDHHNQYNDRIQGGARAMTTAQNDDADQGGPAPNCNRCGLCHFGQCPSKCNRCGRRGHKANDCRKRTVAAGANARPIRACYECGDKNHSRNQCPNLANQRGGNATGRAYLYVFYRET